MKILITKIVPYKEKDAIVSGFNETGNFSILCKGLQNPKNKNVSINNEMTYADIELAENTKSKYDVLKSATVIFTPLKFMGNAQKLIEVMLVGELINKCLTEDEKNTLFKDILSTLKQIDKGKEPRFTLLNLIGKILNISGYSFEVNSCHCCGGKKDIVGFSFTDGGFVCKECLRDNRDAEFSADELVWLRRVFRQDNKDKIVLEHDIDIQSFKKILKMQIYFIQDNYSLKLTNSELLIG